MLKLTVLQKGWIILPDYTRSYYKTKNEHVPKLEVQICNLGNSEQLEVKQSMIFQDPKFQARVSKREEIHSCFFFFFLVFANIVIYINTFSPKRGETLYTPTPYLQQ